MRYHGPRRLRVGVFEHEALGGQAVEVGSGSCFRAQESHAIRARGIESDQDEVRFRCSRCGCTTENNSQSQQSCENSNSSTHEIECNAWAWPRKVGHTMETVLPA